MMNDFAHQVRTVWDDGIEYETFPPADPGEALYWGVHPIDEAAYAGFVRYVLSAASEAAGVEVRNAVIGWTARCEDSPVLTGAMPGGWNDPDTSEIASASRVCDDRDVILRESPVFAKVFHREWTFVSVDARNWERDQERVAHGFVREVMRPLIKLQGSERDRVQTWLAHLAAFCAGKPMAYFARYTPGPSLWAAADRHGATLFPLPIGHFPEAALARHRAFRMLRMTDRQWREMELRLAEAGRWEAVKVVRAHLGEDTTAD